MAGPALAAFVESAKWLTRSATPLIGQAAKSVAFGALSSAQQEILLPLTREAGYRLNWSTPNIYPGFSEAMESWLKGHLTWPQFRAISRWQGVPIEVGIQELTALPQIWQSIIRSRSPVPSVEEALRWRFQNRITTQEYETIIQRNGFSESGITPDQAIYKRLYASEKMIIPLELALQLWQFNLLTQDEIREILRLSGYSNATDQDKFLSGVYQLTPDQAYQQFNMGALDEQEFKKHLRLAGYISEQSQTLFKSLSLPMSPIETLLAYYRGAYTEQEAISRIKANGIINQRDIDAQRELSHPIPGASDLISFALKEVWDQATVDRFGYDDEFPLQFQYWMEKQGFKPQEEAFQYGGQNFPALSWMLAYWRAHWQTISPGQAYEMLHRLRPTGGPNGGPRVPNVTPFTIDDVRTILKVADYPRAFRDRLAAISYNVLTRVDARRLQELRIISKPEASEIFQDQGYSKTDADNLAAFVERKIDIDRLKRLFNITYKRLERGYKLGVIGKADYARGLYLANPESALPAGQYAAMPAAQQEQIALADVFVQNAIAQTDESIDAEYSREAIAAIKRNYVKWIITDQRAAFLLRQAGMIEERVLPTIQHWTILRIQSGRIPTVSNWLTWYQKGIISLSEAYNNLLTIGYLPSDANHMIALSQQGIAAQSAKAQMQIAKDQKAKIKAAADLVKALKKEQQEATKQLAKLGTPAHLSKWYRQEIITREEYVDRLQTMGIAQEDIDNQLEEDDKAIEAKEAKGEQSSETNGELQEGE